MTLKERISLFSSLGKLIKNSLDAKFKEKINQAIQLNPWFTEHHIKTSFDSISQMLEEESLVNWIGSYNLSETKSKDVLIITAGNIPIVGFHDLLCVFWFSLDSAPISDSS